MSGELSDNLFSANDRPIDPSDPVLRAPVNLALGPEPHPLADSHPTNLSVLSALRGGHMGSKGGHVTAGQFPVHMEPDSELLYSFTLPESRPHPSNTPSVAESFGVPSLQPSRSPTASPAMSLVGEIPNVSLVGEIPNVSLVGELPNVVSGSRDITPTPEQPLEELTAGLHHPVRMDSDVETSSVVSVQQLTDAYLNDPFDLAEEKLTAGTNSTVLPVTLPAAVGTNKRTDSRSTKSPQGSKATTPLPLSDQSKLPSHLQPATRKPNGHPPVGSQTEPEHARIQKAHIETERVHSETENEELKEKLSKALQAKANLEGQLESVVSECKRTMGERSELHSKLGQSEAQLAELMAELERERLKHSGPSITPLATTDSGPQLQNSLDTESRHNALLKSELAKEKNKSEQLARELDDTQARAGEQEEQLAAMKQQQRELQSELDKKRNELSEEQCKASSLEASYGALEETKGWLHQQLQESLENKMKLQEELREAKAKGIAQCIKSEQLMRENAEFQEQISELQKGVLQDKAQLVSELEAIEADVLSREDSFGSVLAEKGQLEDMIRMKAAALDRLNDELAESRVALEESLQKSEDVEIKNDALSHQVKELTRAKRALEDKLQNSVQELADRESEVRGLTKQKCGLQEKLREREAEAVGKDGLLQGLNDAREILRQELELTKEADRKLEAELESAKLELAEMGNQLKNAMDKNREKDVVLRAGTSSQQRLAAENELLMAQLSDKDRLLQEKVEELQALESQSGDLSDHFKNLQGQFQSIASKSGDDQQSFAEKDRVISHLSSEKESMEDQLESLKANNDKLQRETAHLKQEKAHLEGKLESSPSKSLEEFQKLVKNRSQLQGELNALKMAHQAEMIKAQSKVEHLESDLKVAKKEKSAAVKEMDNLIRQHEEDVCKLETENTQLRTELRNLSSRPPPSGSPGLQHSLRQSEVDKDKLKQEIKNLLAENKQLAEQVEQELAQKSEIERAGTVVAKNLKQNAHENEKKLQEELQDLTIQLEKLRGQLSGMELTQSAMREHTTGLELALAKREAALLKLSAHAQRILEDKEFEDKSTSEKLAVLEEELASSRKSQVAAREREKAERSRSVELSTELDNKNREIVGLQQSIEQLSQVTMETQALQDKFSELTSQKTNLKSELLKMTSQLQISRTASGTLQRALSDKESQVAILTQELAMNKETLKQREQEIAHLQSEQVRSLEGVSGRGLFDASISSIGTEDTDHPGGSEGSSLSDKTVSDLIGQSSLYRAQLQEMGSRLQQARRQGQKVAEITKSGEINALQQQLGTKSRANERLRSCLGSLREEMGQLQHQMDRHSASMASSHASTRQIEDQIENLRRSSSIPSPLYLATPSSQSGD